ncbi:MAG: aspartate aminotransferase family protein [Gammaproteobacteria bacterium]|nr:aspartate aminotransferase family protein [Gammaproteobacteria bacterium]MCW8923322.1 aspartate aminotransferase family protein [Gammaproteobacteria bacterium]
MTNFETLRDKYACPCDESTMYEPFLLPVKAEGMKVWFDGDPEPYIDLVLGYSSNNFGHNHPLLVKAAQDAAAKIAQIHSFHTKDKLLLSQYLADKVSKEQPYNVYFDIGGTSVVASAIRLCRSYTKKRYIVCFDGAYHGASQLGASVTDDGFIDKAQYVINNVSDFVIRLPFPGKHTDVTTDDSIRQLEEAIQNNDVAGVIVEPVQGANGFIFPEDDFLPRLREVTESNEVMLIMDEIQVGLGRIGHFFAYQKWGIVPDIVVLSKSLSGGFYPLSAIIARPQLFNSVSSNATAFQSTFNNNPLGINIALKVMEFIENENCLENSMVKGETLLHKLSFLEDSPYISNLRGEGLAIAFDMTEKNAPNQPSKKYAKKLKDVALDEHLIIYSCGRNGDVIKLAPSLMIEDKDIEFIVNKLKIVLEKAGLI